MINIIGGFTEKETNIEFGYKHFSPSSTTYNFNVSYLPKKILIYGCDENDASKTSLGIGRVGLNMCKYRTTSAFHIDGTKILRLDDVTGYISGLTSNNFSLTTTSSSIVINIIWLALRF